MLANSAGSISGMNCRISSPPPCTKRKPVPEKRALPPYSDSGAFSSITTRSAPAWRAATAASKAALPPPTPTMSQRSVRKLIPRTLFLGPDAGEGHVFLHHRLRHRRQPSHDQRLELGAADRTPDRQATLVGLGAVFGILHQPHVGVAQHREPLGR